MIFFEKKLKNIFSGDNMETLGEVLGTLGDRLTCKNCSKTYKNRTGLWRHKKLCSETILSATLSNNLATQGYNLATESNTLATTAECQDLFKCQFCEKQYHHRQGLWRHNKKCYHKQEIQCKENLNTIDKDELIMIILKQNAQLMEQNNGLMEIVKNGTHNTINNTNTHTNSHNKAFNLNFFLNETCKNAMNITDFVESIKLQLSDFVNMGETGFVEGISNIIVQNLNSLDETVRPIHCTDQKRETFYLKDKNIWEKEDEDKKRLKQMIKSIAYKNEKLIKTYKETYPDYNDSESKRSDQYSKIMIEAMDCKEESRDKIIRNISKATIIKKKD
jgi:hypothetical protein